MGWKKLPIPHNEETDSLVPPVSFSQMIIVCVLNLI